MLPFSELPTRDGLPIGTTVRPVATRAQPIGQMRDRTGAERDIDEWIALEEMFPLSLGIASADRNDRRRIGSLERARLSQVCGESLIRPLANRARVEDDDSSFGGGRSFTQPKLFEHALDPLRVVSVHLTAESG